MPSPAFSSEIRKEITTTNKDPELSMDFPLLTGIFANQEANNFLDKQWVCVCVCVCNLYKQKED